MTLTSCEKNDKNQGTIDLNESLNKIKDNYEMNVDIYIYNEIKSTLVIKYDGNKSYYQENNNVEFYFERITNRLINVYEKQGERFSFSEESSVRERKYDFFGKIKSDWFVLENDKFILEDDFFDNIMELIIVDKSITLNYGMISISENDEKIKFEFRFKNERDPYFMYIAVNNINNVNIVLPVVN